MAKTSDQRNGGPDCYSDVKLGVVPRTKVDERYLAKLDAERINLVAQHHAINGAIQQCDLFIKALGGVGGDADSSIPSEEEGS